MNEIKEILRYKYEEPRLLYSSDDSTFNLIPTFTLTLIGIAGKYNRLFKSHTENLAQYVINFN